MLASEHPVEVYIRCHGAYAVSYVQYCSPIAVLKSDRSRIIFLELNELIETFQTKILQPIIDLCDEYRLYLDL
jgi:hypothetical protein